MKLIRIFFLCFLVSSSVVFANAFFINSDGERQEIVCGDGICSIGENPQNCPIDCLNTTFNARLETATIFLSQNEEFVQRLHITSYKLEDDFYVIRSTDSEIAEIIQQTITIQNQSAAFVDILFRTPTESEYTGEIKIENSNETKSVFYTITVLDSSARFANVQIQPLGSRFFPDQEIRFRSYIQFPYVLSNAIIEFSIEQSESENIVLSRHENLQTRVFDQIHQFTLTDYKQNDSLDEITIIARVMYQNQEFEVRETISFSQRFFDNMYIRILLGLVLFLFLSVLLFKLFLIIRRRQRDKRRYVLPNFSLLPSKDHGETTFEVGQIADTKRPAFFHASDLTTHALVAGSTGSGKSVTASIIVEEALNNKIPAVIFDPTAQWTGLLSSLKDPNILSYYPQFHLHPEDDVRSYRGLIFTPKNADFDLHFKEYMNPGEATIFNLAQLSVKEYDEAVKKIIDKMFEVKWEESPDLKLVVIFDEVHRLLDKNASGQGYAALTKAAREFRKWGIGLVMASQVSSDFKEAIGGNVLTEVQLNTKNLSDIQKIAKKYNPEFAKRITRQGIGVALVQNPKYNKGKPWFVQFRPPLHNPHKLPAESLLLYEKYTNKLAELQVQLSKIQDEALKEDLQMDFHLANTKLREGKFKMAEIYIQGIEERLQKK
ncbi:MAG: ATP-binding protein [Candidatus Woesearchaeota archaeon]